MPEATLLDRVRQVVSQPVPLPGSGQTAARHARLFAVAREDLSLARLVEAHWDALAILSEAGKSPAGGAIYGVWAAEAPDSVLRVQDGTISGIKPFCSGAGLVDRALITVREPEPLLIDVDLRAAGGHVRFDGSVWQTAAFGETCTATATFHAVPFTSGQVVGEAGFYLARPGFWHGACGPAACWAGGAAGLLDWALRQRRSDPHTLAHLGAMHAAIWNLQAMLRVAGEEIDADWHDRDAAHRRALSVRHLVEQSCTDVLQHFGRAYGPHPLAMDAAASMRCAELTLYLRQCHAERDLEALGRAVREHAAVL